MVKQLLQSWLPSHERVSSMKMMKMFGTRTANPLLWYVNRRSICKAIFIGTFFGLLPIPFHSIFIVLAVLCLEINLPVSLALAWLSNPFTIVPILYIGFWFGSKIFHVHMINQAMLKGVMHQIGRWIQNFGHGHIDGSLAKILMTGLVVEALLFSILFYIATQLFWRWSVIRNWKKRQRLRPKNPL
ncbi:DUF2062 domain-containing protein [Acinetobacter sp. MD2]|uniref:DUF2062 domain-containing protein n=1 Tax=Acinetobacter sp. MD2 TaxID=2600066 RepID=UPI002D1E5528|nr:DUF2062 domain-containing protein [Acinetobacter sp. MD2]MEB3767466.1 DUF2062 domain-containing protein [Acinetobacter sp. MD2]